MVRCVWPATDQREGWLGSRSMVSTGGGGGLPSFDSPFEIGIALVVLAVVVWVGFKFFAD